MTDDDRLSLMIQACQQGRPEGFNWLLQQYGPKLYRFFLRNSGSPADAEDLVQDLFVRLLEKIHVYRHQGQFDSWLFRVALNLMRDAARRQKRQPSLSSSQNLEDDKTEWMAQAAVDQAAPEQHLQSAEMADQLQQALQQLPQLDREIILMRHYGPLSFKEIAETFQIPIGTALAKVHRGLKRLRETLEEKDHE